VSEVVQGERRDAGFDGRVPEPALARAVYPPEIVAVEAGEQQVVLSLVRAGTGNGGGERRRERDRALLVRLRGAHVDPVADLHRVLTDVEPAPERVHVHDPQPCCLAPPQPAVGEHEDERPKVAGGDRQLADLVVRQIGVRLLALAGHLHAAGGIGEDLAVADRDVEDCREHAVRADYDGRTPTLTHFGHPSADVAVSDI
jgi:hypothetical protein